MHNNNNKHKKTAKSFSFFFKILTITVLFINGCIVGVGIVCLCYGPQFLVKSIISRKFSYIVSRKKGTIMENLDRGTMNWRRWCLRSLFGGKIDNQTYYHCSSQYTCQKHEFFLKWLKKKKNHNNFKRYMQTVALVL